MNALGWIFDNRRPDSLATRMRQRRFSLFRKLFAGLPGDGPWRILDVGGTQQFWERMGLTDERLVRVVVLNLNKDAVTLPNFTAVAADARNLHMYGDGEFDIVFSNSVIEHVGGFEDQVMMAREVQRVGRRYFVQTPNRYFPIEPHFLFPYWQFLPLGWRVLLIQRFNIGWFKRRPDPREALALVSHIRLLNEAEMRQLFPNALLYKERLLGLTKSFVAYGGWELTSGEA